MAHAQRGMIEQSGVDQGSTCSTNPIESPWGSLFLSAHIPKLSVTPRGRPRFSQVSTPLPPGVLWDLPLNVYSWGVHLSADS